MFPFVSVAESIPFHHCHIAHQPPAMLEYFAPAPKGETLLSQYRLLSPSAGVRVSPLCLGAMSLGDQWSPFMGGKDMGLKESMEFLYVAG
jgi:hypothetical protein